MSALPRLVVGVVFLVAGVLKMRDPAWARSAARFGLPAVAAPVLPWIEIVLGAVLVVGLGLPWTALVALVMLLAFTVAVAWRVLRGDPVPCACFGSASTAPVSRWTVARNLGLTALAALAVVA